MACATCDHTMQKVSDPAWWCPRCGTIKDHVQQQPTDRERIAELERDLEKARADERELCAKLCYEADKNTHPSDLGDAIRALGDE